MTNESTREDLPEELRSSVDRCIATNAPVAGVTRGLGTSYSIDLAGTSFRKDLIVTIARRYPGEAYAAACLLREPTNEHDANAVRAFVDGHHVGYLKSSDAPKWQACILDCERRGLVLCREPPSTGLRAGGSSLR